MIKRIFSLSLALITLLSIAFVLTSCKPKNMEFGKSKYVYENKTTTAGVEEERISELAFKRDGTGVYRHYYKVVNGGRELKIDGVVYFEWEETSNGEIFLLETGSEYYSYSKEGEVIKLPSSGLTFGDGFLSYTEDGVTYRYMLQKQQ